MSYTKESSSYRQTSPADDAASFNDAGPEASSSLSSISRTHHIYDASYQSQTGEKAQIAYTATAGYQELVEETISDGYTQEPRNSGHVFLTTYEADREHDEGGVSSGGRPVIFAFNGGPGTSSAWLHLGLLGPRIVEPFAEGSTHPKAAPYTLLDNRLSPIAYADIVIIDAISTGYSRTANGEQADHFHESHVDVLTFSEIIREWVTQHERWSDPLYIVGESYGVLRASAVADYLARRDGIYISGLVLISSPITLGRMDFNPGSILGSHAFLPSYAAVAHYHGFNANRTLEEVVAEAEDFADTQYLWALNQGNRLSETQRSSIIATLSRLTGLQSSYIDQANLIIEPGHFRAELLRKNKQSIGRYDGRITGSDEDQNNTTPESDATEQAVRGVFAAGINSYLREELKYKNDLAYNLDTDQVRPWRIPADQTLNPFNALRPLARVLRTNVNLRVLYQLGKYDLCTPFWGAQSDVSLLHIPQESRQSIEIHTFNSGHMIYLDPASREIELTQIRQFITSPRP
ncbi:MAG: hypothetical protein LKF41_05900 [Bifidobacterium sp.]|jgi:carboxypeptidase C (cathepsin A)|nr:hypothetical protein [Bifidobacterium sp.]MCH4175377.1 hypothetical protein [Bifidobacterium sp.]